MADVHRVHVVHFQGFDGRMDGMDLMDFGARSRSALSWFFHTASAAVLISGAFFRICWISVSICWVRVRRVSKCGVIARVLSSLWKVALPFASAEAARLDLMMLRPRVTSSAMVL